MSEVTFDQMGRVFIATGTALLKAHDLAEGGDREGSLRLVVDTCKALFVAMGSMGSFNVLKPEQLAGLCNLVDERHTIADEQTEQAAAPCWWADESRSFTEIIQDYTLWHFATLVLEARGSTALPALTELGDRQTLLFAVMAMITNSNDIARMRSICDRPLGPLPPGTMRDALGEMTTIRQVLERCGLGAALPA